MTMDTSNESKFALHEACRRGNRLCPLSIIYFTSIFANTKLVVSLAEQLVKVKHPLIQCILPGDNTDEREGVP